jgi:hypothetical protein
MHTLIIYFIHGKCVDITLNHHLRLKVQCNFIYTTKGSFSYKVDESLVRHVHEELGHFRMQQTYNLF